MRTFPLSEETYYFSTGKDSQVQLYTTLYGRKYKFPLSCAQRHKACGKLRPRQSSKKQVGILIVNSLLKISDRPATMYLTAFYLILLQCVQTDEDLYVHALNLVGCYCSI